MDFPLYTVVVFSYNSAKYIEQTLQSVYEQTYRNIELIITDDCSTDGTAMIARQWLELHKQRFVKCLLTATDQNSGIAANCNHAIRHSSGDYMKFIAADDLMLPNCIENFASYKNPYDLAFCKGYYFTNKSNLAEKDIESKLRPTFLPPNHPNYTGKKLFRKLLICNIFPGAAAVIKRSVLENLGLFDEQYRLLEDYPFWVKAAQKELRFEFVHLPGFLYRKHSASLSVMAGKTISLEKREYYTSMLNFSYTRQRMMVNKWMPLHRWSIIVERMYIRLVLKGFHPGLARLLELLSPAYVWIQFIRLMQKK